MRGETSKPSKGLAIRSKEKTKPFEQIGNLFEQKANSFEQIHNSSEQKANPFEQIHNSSEQKANHFDQIGNPFEQKTKPFEQKDNSYGQTGAFSDAGGDFSIEKADRVAAGWDLSAERRGLSGSRVEFSARSAHPEYFYIELLRSRSNVSIWNACSDGRRLRWDGTKAKPLTTVRTSGR